jgi:hypothetical protein
MHTLTNVQLTPFYRVYSNLKLLKFNDIGRDHFKWLIPIEMKMYKFNSRLVLWALGWILTQPNYVILSFNLAYLHFVQSSRWSRCFIFDSVFLRFLLYAWYSISSPLVLSLFEVIETPIKRARWLASDEPQTMACLKSKPSFIKKMCCSLVPSSGDYETNLSWDKLGFRDLSAWTKPTVLISCIRFLSLDEIFIC